MTPQLILITFLAYTVLLFFITWLTARKANSESFFIGNKSSPWMVVAYGMIGASLSGVTFMSVPGWVKDTQFSYMMVVFGYLFGYLIIATVLLPLYYRLNLTSIYSYLEKRFGIASYKTGASFFLLSRTIGASLRMFLVVNVLQVFVFDAWNIPFFVTVTIFVGLIILYTFKGGIKTIIWTDTLQTTFMLLAVVLSIIFISQDLNLGFSELISSVFNSDSSNIIITDWHDKRFFVKQFISGMFITIVMTGLDQEMMQKNLSCKNIRSAQKNMFSFSLVLVFVNFLFLVLGAVLLFYMTSKGLSFEKTDDVFPGIALNYLSPVAGIVFLIGLISAAYPSADGALTSLTTSFCIDILGIKKKNYSEQKQVKIRYTTHIGFAIILLLFIVFFRSINDKAVIDKLFTIAGYTYGPLLGLYSFGLFTKKQVKDKFVPIVAILSPIICHIININSEVLLNGYKFGFELLLLNGLLTFIGLLILQSKNTNKKYEKL
ncbi:MAG: sodium:solute symporter [Bacteroidetes bacterium RIFOXYA12_FULL_35_11]|nr:MAG: sodium:solute symporter [Bacteroidetes bacterium GWF2_35_48]OFY76747.1 MAG: sodium:solute symporter [Bacteroidetes bacterium RIFOXYA12_FULL_35_11]OFY96251.1 MAG: sodium:solute symporter [Bacteroidetes bacterium RIFOXYB2_FULL_35_7]OFZ06236.1 MAG: sodium:solute symporter [Bacteroidetes bacterium RIFOXYC12_FULL_35_7]HBX52343.1 sodium:solute symporter [Bacteroidales bacterium]